MYDSLSMALKLQSIVEGICFVLFLLFNTGYSFPMQENVSLVQSSRADTLFLLLLCIL